MLTLTDTYYNKISLTSEELRIIEGALYSERAEALKYIEVLGKDKFNKIDKVLEKLSVLDYGE